MGSSAQFASGLNNWVASDKPKMNDFVSDNRIVDENAMWRADYDASGNVAGAGGIPGYVEQALEDLAGEVSQDVSQSVTAQVTANLSELMQAATALYVSLAGNDTTGDGSQNKPYRTLQKALDMIPLISSSVTISIAAGDYIADGAARLSNRIVLGNLIINGSTAGTLADAQNYKMRSLSLSNVDAMVSISGLMFNVSAANEAGVQCANVKNASVSVCMAKATAGAVAGTIGFHSSGSTVMILHTCAAESCSYGYYTSSMGHISTWMCTGKDNGMHMISQGGGILSQLSALTITGSGTETFVQGGLVVKPSGAVIGN